MKIIIAMFPVVNMSMTYFKQKNKFWEQLSESTVSVFVRDKKGC